MTEKAMLRKYGDLFFEESVIVRKLVCMELLDPNEPSSLEAVSELIEDLERPECLALFNLPKDFLDTNEDWTELITRERKGWLIFAYVSIPPEKLLIRDLGKRLTLLYGETLEDALQKLYDYAVKVRN